MKISVFLFHYLTIYIGTKKSNRKGSKLENHGIFLIKNICVLDFTKGSRSCFSCPTTKRGEELFIGWITKEKELFYTFFLFQIDNYTNFILTTLSCSDDH